MDFKSFDKKMRSYEQALDQYLLPDMWAVIRVDGRSFGTFIKKQKLQRPFDKNFYQSMITTTKYLMDIGFHCLLAYVASDEISILIDKEDVNFHRKIQKWITLFAGSASAAFSIEMGSPASFDARVSQLPSIEAIVDYFRWRQFDCRRNALTNYCYWTLRNEGLSKNKATSLLKGITFEEKIELLKQKGINYTKDILRAYRRGSMIYFGFVEKTGVNPLTGEKHTTTRRRLIELDKLPIENDFGQLIRDLI